MQFSDTATALLRSESRPSINQQWGYNATSNNSLKEGIVVKVGTLENFESSLLVYIYSTKETFKVEGGLANGASAATTTGQFRPYFVGDRVLVSYLNGDPSRPTITGRAYDQNGISEYLLQPGNPIPKLGDKTATGTTVRPNPLAVTPEATRQAGFITLDVHPILVI